MEEDIIILALTLYREARGESKEGQIAVANVIANRVKKNHSSFYAECVKPLQFSSMTSKGDSQLVVWPDLASAIWLGCKNIAYAAVNGDLPDTTNGSTLYYAPNSIAFGNGKTISLKDGSRVPFPKTWNPERVDEQGKIGNHIFFREVSL